MIAHDRCCKVTLVQSFSQKNKQQYMRGTKILNLEKGRTKLLLTDDMTTRKY